MESMRAYAKGDLIFSEGEPGDAMYVIWDGRVEIFRDLSAGRVSLAVLERGDFFGEMALIEHKARSAGAMALEACQLRLVDGPTFMRLIREDVELPLRLIRKYSVRLRETNARLEAVLAASLSGSALTTQELDMSALDFQIAHAPPFGRLVSKLSGREFAISGHEVTIGRVDPATGIHPSVDLACEDVVYSVSRRHARILRSDDELVLAEELGVSNGTWLNDVRLKTGVLNPLVGGDQLRIGQVTLILELH